MNNENRVGIFVSRFASKTDVKKARRLFEPLGTELIFKAPKTEDEVQNLPGKVAVLLGGDGTTRMFLSALYKQREILSQRAPLLLVTIGNFGTLGKMDRLLRKSGRVLALEKIMEIGEKDLQKFAVPVATADKEPFLLDCSIGHFEGYIWERDRDLRGKIPKMFRIPLRHFLGFQSAVREGGRGGFIFDTIFTNPIIGPKGIFPEVEFASGKLGRITISGTSRREDVVKLSLVLFHLQLGKRPPAELLNYTEGTTFHIPTRINPVALDGDLVALPDSEGGAREVRGRSWELPMVALAHGY